MCKYKKNGVCHAPIPLTCHDECGFKHEMQLYLGALKELEETRNELEEKEKQYELLASQNEALKKQIALLQKEISFTD